MLLNFIFHKKKLVSCLVIMPDGHIDWLFLYSLAHFFMDIVGLINICVSSINQYLQNLVLLLDSEIDDFKGHICPLFTIDGLGVNEAYSTWQNTDTSKFVYFSNFLSCSWVLFSTLPLTTHNI